MWEGILRLKFRVILLVVVTQVRWGEVPTPTLPWMKGKSLLEHWLRRRQEAEGGRGGRLLGGLLRGLKCQAFWMGSEPNWNKNIKPGGKVYRPEGFLSGKRP